jgi:hypothetical protein
MLGKNKIPIIPVPKTNYCEFIRNSKSVPFLSVITSTLEKFCTMPLACPIKPGHYVIDNFYVDDSRLVLLPAFGDARYMVQAFLTDENGKTIVSIVKLTTIFSYVKESELVNCI